MRCILDETGLLFDNRFEDISQLLRRDIDQSLAALIELLVDFDRRFLHASVRLLRPATEHEIAATGDASLAVFSIQSDSQQSGVSLWLQARLAGRFHVQVLFSD